jgi:Tfp pilus assembly protein PilP
VDPSADVVTVPELSSHKAPEDPEAIPVYNALEKWHRDLMASYVVDLAALRDPFMPIETVARPPETERPQVDTRRLPMIQRLALNQFTLTAIITSPNPAATVAQVESGGIGYLIHRGDKIGPNNGVVREITDTKVVIEEPEINYRGEQSTRVTEMSLNSLDSSVESEGGGN